MPPIQGPSSFDQMQQMGGGGGGGGEIGILPILTGTNLDQPFMVNISDDKGIQITGFENAEEGMLPKLFAMRGEGFLGRLLDMFKGGEEAFTSLNDIGEGRGGAYTEGDGSFGGGDGGGANFDDGGGSNRAFAGLPAMDMAGPAYDVPVSSLGGLTPSASPGMGGHGMGMGGGMDF